MVDEILWSYISSDRVFDTVTAVSNAEVVDSRVADLFKLSHVVLSEFKYEAVNSANVRCVVD